MGKLLLQSDLRNARKRLCQRGPALGRGKLEENSDKQSQIYFVRRT